jgi:SAM-dependent methyltransferase
MSGWNESQELILKEINFVKKNVLDVGCGNGWFSHWAYNMGCNVDALDPSSDQITEAKRIDKLNKINFMEMGAESIHKLDNIYDYIFFFNSLHHIPKNIMPACISQCKKKIKPEGSIIIVEPIAKGSFHNFVKNIDDETEVRNYAYNVIKNCGEYNLQILKEFIYNEIKSFNSGDDCINFLAKVDKSRNSYINNNKEFLLNEFNNLSNYIDNKYKFIQPMRLNILINKL